ncbi:MAG: hypothetical protein MI864_00815, partial [Pseudomonadales bacterium]|nr:hypothetical protein [Pseudomonadales bacterium]
MMEFRKEMRRTGEFPHRGRGIPGVLWKNFLLWFDSEAVNRAEANQDADSDNDIVRRVNWVRCFPFLVVHLACIAVLWTGWSPFAVGICIALFWVRMFAVTAFYHRYFSHRSFKASRGWQFVFAVLGNSAAQRGPLWWASHHRRHHKHSDQLQDVHSPVRHGFWWS